MERSAATSYLVCAEGPPFLAIGPMDKNAQLHWTFRWPSCPVCNNYEFCVLWPSNAVLRKVVPTATCLPKGAMSALPQRTDIAQRERHDRKVPTGDMLKRQLRRPYIVDIQLFRH